jgi:GNAT superfamily N-acetyltransferase
LFDRLVHLRAAESSDLGFLADVVISATRDQGRSPDEFDEAGFRVEFEHWTTEQIAGRVEGSSTYVIEVDGERVGRLRIIRDRRGVELAGIQLLARFQSRGIGSEIVALLKTEVASAGSSLELSVDMDVAWKRTNNDPICAESVPVRHISRSKNPLTSSRSKPTFPASWWYRIRGCRRMTRS